MCKEAAAAKSGLDTADVKARGAGSTWAGADGTVWVDTCAELTDAPSRAKVRDLNEFVDLFRRLQTPYYEDARRRFNDEDVKDRYADASSYRPYMQDALEWIASNDRP